MGQKKYQDPREDSFFGTSFIIYLVLAAIGALFLGVMGAYLYNRMLFDLAPIAVPDIFYLSSAVVIIVSILCARTLNSFDQSNFNRVISYWMIILVAVIVFMVLQMMGWVNLIESGYPASRNNSVGYLYALSALHLFHILIGIPFHIRLFWRQVKVWRSDEFSRIEYIAQNSNRQHLQLMSRYWHFLDILWIILMAFFLFNNLFT
jgi:cytochrome c oxidase subunit 3